MATYNPLPPLWVILAVLWSATAFAAPWPRWEAHDPGSARIIDHSAWTGILERYVRAGDDGIARFACAAVTQPVAFTAANTDELLARGVHTYVNHPRGVAFVEGGLVVSSIYEWFQADFGGSESTVIEHLERYAEPALRDRLAQRERHDDHHYDRVLNGVR